MAKRHLARAVYDKLDIPGDGLLGMPRILLRGNHHLHLENHRGIVECTATCMRVRTALGMVEVTGDALVVCELGKETLSLSGHIVCIHL